MKHKILFVDDEENILKALQRLLRKSPYEIFYASSGTEALKYLNENEISVLVTDMRMPEMDGLALIIEANKISQHTIKTILSGYSDINDIMTAINNGHVHNYITKPWNEAELMISLLNATELYERRINEKNLIEELNQLNASLEKRIKDRTWELQANNVILNSIIEGEDHEKIMIGIAGLISKISGSKPVSIWANYNSKLYGSKFLNPESEIIKIGLEKTKPCIINKILVVPLFKGAELLGGLFIKDVTKEELQFVKRIENMQALLRMYLSQKAMLSNSAEVIGSIDILLGNIDE